MDTSICGFEVFPERLSGVEDGPGDIDASAREGDEGCRHAVLALHSDQSQSLISVRVRRRDRAVLPPEPSRAASMAASGGPLPSTRIAPNRRSAKAGAEAHVKGRAA